MLSGPTSYAESVDSVMLFIVAISVFLLLGITFFMVYFVIKYNRKKHPVAKQIEGNTFLEILWIGIPTILVMFMFWLGYSNYKELRATASEAMIVKVTAKMWEWTFEYKNGTKTDTLYIPVDRTTRLDMISDDVVHSLFIPAFRLKEDVVGSRTNYMILTPEKIGNYVIACAEYCGLKHSNMYSQLVVMSEKDFDKWMGKEEIQAPKEVSIKEPHPIFSEKGCVACHSFDGSKIVGPSFKDLSDGFVTVVTDGEARVVEVNKEYLRRSIINPNIDIVKGYTKFMMPDLDGRLTDEDIEKMVEELIALVK